MDINTFQSEILVEKNCSIIYIEWDLSNGLSILSR